MPTKLKPLPLYKRPPRTWKQFQRRAIGLLEKGWCQRAIARDSKDCSVGALNPRAVRVCLQGAIFRCRVPALPGTCNAIADAIYLKSRSHLNITYFNDEIAKSVSEVTAVIRAAKCPAGFGK